MHECSLGNRAKTIGTCSTVLSSPLSDLRLVEHAPGSIATVALGTHERNSLLAIHDLNDEPWASAALAGVGA